METRDSITNNETSKMAWAAAARKSAFVLACLIVLICILLIISYLQMKLVIPIRAERLELLKVKSFESASDQQLQSQIRQLDLQVRTGTVRYHSFMAKGAYLLLGFAAALVLSIKVGWADRKQVSSPRIRQASKVEPAAMAVGVVSGLVAAGLLVSSLGKTVEFRKAQLTLSSGQEISEHWSAFRGPHGDGTSECTGVPFHWDDANGMGIGWKTEIPLPGFNSPIIWDQKVFLSGASQELRRVYCLDAASGKLLWQAEVENTAKQLKLDDATGYAPNTMVTDGRYVCSIFPTGDIACFTVEGVRAWSRSLGQPDNMYGHTSSLRIYKDSVLVQFDQGSIDDGKSRIFAIDIASGQTVWEVKRPVGSSWSSPIVARIDGRDEVITCGDPLVIAYDPLSGVENWRVEGLGTDLVPSPVTAGKFIIAIQPNSKMFAINTAGMGDNTKTNIVWQVEGSMPEICSPVSNGRFIWTLGSQGQLTCYNAADGKIVWEHNFTESFMASPCLADGRLYLLSENGIMHILKAGGEFSEIAMCSIGEKCYASPAFADNRIYIRSTKHLFCITGHN